MWHTPNRLDNAQVNVLIEAVAVPSFHTSFRFSIDTLIQIAANTSNYLFETKNKQRSVPIKKTHNNSKETKQRSVRNEKKNDHVSSLVKFRRCDYKLSRSFDLRCASNFGTFLRISNRCGFCFMRRISHDNWDNLRASPPTINKRKENDKIDIYFMFFHFKQRKVFTFFIANDEKYLFFVAFKTTKRIDILAMNGNGTRKVSAKSD